jgi:nucleotide-binding universal stress UspA family protein
VVTPSGVFEYDDDDYFDEDRFDEDRYLQEAKRDRDRGRELLDTYGDTAADRGVAVETKLAFGKPAREILETVDSAGVDHVVMGSRGRSGLDRVLFGSVAEAVTRRATVPVTIVP